MPFELFYQTAGLGGRKSLIKRSGFVRAEIVLYQGDLLHVRKPAIRHVPEEVGVIHRRVALRDRDVPPAVERREQHEDIGGSVAFVLVIGPRRVPGPDRDRHARFLDQLFGGLVQTDQRAGRIVRTVIDFQHLFHRRDEGGVSVRWDDPLIFQMRFEKVFLTPARSCCRWRVRRSSIPQPCLPTASVSTATGPWAAASRPRRSVWLPRRHQKCAYGPSSGNAFASELPRSLLRPTAGVYARQWQGSCPALLRCGCRSSPHPPRRHQP